MPCSNAVLLHTATRATRLPVGDIWMMLKPCCLMFNDIGLSCAVNVLFFGVERSVGKKGLFVAC